VILGSAESERLKLISHEIIFDAIRTYVIMIPLRHRQTDRQTTCRSNTALCVASRGNKPTHLQREVIEGNNYCELRYSWGHGQQTKKTRNCHLPNCRSCKNLTVGTNWQYDDGRNNDDQIYNEQEAKLSLE